MQLLIGMFDGCDHAIRGRRFLLPSSFDVTWASGDAEGDAGREDADAGVGCVLAQQFDEDDATLQQGSEARIAQPLQIRPAGFSEQRKREARSRILRSRHPSG